MGILITILYIIGLGKTIKDYQMLGEYKNSSIVISLLILTFILSPIVVLLSAGRKLSNI